MPGRNGTGPLGEGAMTGRGLGSCNTAGQVIRDNNYGRRLGCGKGSGRGSGLGLGRGIARANLDRKTLLTEEKKMLKNRLEKINQLLENL